MLARSGLLQVPEERLSHASPSPSLLLAAVTHDPRPGGYRWCSAALPKDAASSADTAAVAPVCVTGVCDRCDRECPGVCDRCV